MAYRRGYRGTSPANQERKEREQRAEKRRNSSRARLRRLIGQYRKVPLTGQAARDAWAQKELRSFTTGETRDGSIQYVIRGKGKELYLQEPSGMGWSFYKLVPNRTKAKRKRKYIAKASRIRLVKPTD